MALKPVERFPGDLPYFPNLLWLRLMYSIVNKILMIVIAGYGTNSEKQGCRNQAQYAGFVT
jgi:hypothetical protein